MDKLVMNGQISKDGKPLMNPEKLNEFLRKHKGKNFVINFEILPNETSKAQVGYYYKVLVPEFQEIFKQNEGEVMTLAAVDERLREGCPIMIDEVEVEGRFVAVLRSPYDLSTKAMTESIEYLRGIAIRDYGHFIDDPKV